MTERIGATTIGISLFADARSASVASALIMFAAIYYNAILPGIVDTPMQDHVLQKLSEIRGIPLETLTSKRLETVPLGRSSKPEETANFIYFLISDQGKYITGQSLSQDGGIVM